jgi:hypothetical protein
MGKNSHLFSLFTLTLPGKNTLSGRSLQYVIPLIAKQENITVSLFHGNRLLFNGIHHPDLHAADSGLQAESETV